MKSKEAGGNLPLQLVWMNLGFKSWLTLSSKDADVGKFREHSERLAIVSYKLDSLERLATDFDRRRMECIQQVAEQFR